MTLVILAAGLGSRYGGLKQIDPLGPNGEFIIDYSIYDAVRAGFDNIAFIIKEENYEIFRETIGDRVAKHVNVQYVFQDPNMLPSPVDVKDRTKPWGTSHALYCCKGQINDKFAIINADDFYGADSYRIAAEYLRSLPENATGKFAMIGFMLKNTLTDSGTVARGICEVNEDNELTKIDERTKIKRNYGVIQYLEEDKWYDVDEEAVASMNFWAFTPDVFEGLESGWDAFVERSKDNLQKAEYLLPTRIGEMINEGKCTVTVVPSTETWHGVTYKEDKDFVIESFRQLIADGVYSRDLFSDL